jgi:hypothetical protein
MASLPRDLNTTALTEVNTTVNGQQHVSDMVLVPLKTCEAMRAIAPSPAIARLGHRYQTTTQGAHVQLAQNLLRDRNFLKELIDNVQKYLSYENKDLIKSGQYYVAVEQQIQLLSSPALDPVLRFHQAEVRTYSDVVQSMSDNAKAVKSLVDRIQPLIDRTDVVVRAQQTQQHAFNTLAEFESKMIHAINNIQSSNVEKAILTTENLMERVNRTLTAVNEDLVRTSVVSTLKIGPEFSQLTDRIVDNLKKYPINRQAVDKYKSLPFYVTQAIQLGLPVLSIIQCGPMVHFETCLSYISQTSRKYFSLLRKDKPTPNVQGMFQGLKLRIYQRLSHYRVIVQSSKPEFGVYDHKRNIVSASKVAAFNITITYDTDQLVSDLQRQINSSKSIVCRSS